MNQYYVKKVFSNNIIQCQISNEDKDCIVQGKGIGFHCKKGDIVPLDMIEKVYFRSNLKKMNQYLSLVENCDPMLVEAVEEVIRQMEKQFGSEYDEYVHISLLDHLNFSLYRYHHQITMNNIFLDEYRMMYEKEYTFAQKMLIYINQCLQITLPESEIGFITLHIHAVLHKKSASKSSFYMQVIAKCISKIEEHLQVTLDVGSIERMRLVTHLKFALQRADQHVELSNPILELLKEQYAEVYTIAQNLADMMKEEFHIELPEGELGYLILHIQNIVMTL